MKLKGLFIVKQIKQIKQTIFAFLICVVGMLIEIIKEV